MNPGIEWSVRNRKVDRHKIRTRILDAFLAHMLQTNPRLTPKEEESLRRFATALSKLVPMLDGNEKMAIALGELIELAARGEAERSNTKVEDEYAVRYGDGTSGISSIRVSRDEIARLSEGNMRGMGIGKGTISNRSYSLLVGEVYQQAAKKVLGDLTVLGHKVVRVKPLRPNSKVGRRIDDWVIILSNGLRIPVEVKSSTKVRYFESAFGQITNELKKRRYALFVGFFISKRTQMAIVTLVKKGERLEVFRAKLKKLVIMGN